MKTLTPTMQEQMMDEIDIFAAQDLADRHGKPVYAYAYFNGQYRDMLTLPKLTFNPPKSKSSGGLSRAVMLVTKPGL